MATDTKAPKAEDTAPKAEDTAPKAEEASVGDDEAIVLTEAGEEHVSVPGADFGLPPGIDPADLTPDPARRAGHWHHKGTDQVFVCPAGWKPKK